MFCSHCTTELLAGAAFCGACGTPARARRQTLVGTVIDARFHVDERIAEGGFGAIYRATDVDSGRAIALKVLRAELATDERLAARFRREGAALSSLTSPHTVSTFAVGTAPDGTMYIAMELLRGESLFDRLHREGAMPWRRAVGILRAVCMSLSEAHARGIVHRDLKPANIQLELRGGNPDFVKVLDFGIAKVLPGSTSDDGDELTIAGQAIGTLEYMAPEQLVGGDCDGRTDLYTLGVVAYELLTGARPFGDATGPTSLVTALLTRSPAPPSSLAAAPIPRSLDAIVLRCLERDPDHRFANVDDLLAALDALVTRHPVAPANAIENELEIDDEPTWIDRPAPTYRPSPDVQRVQLAIASAIAVHAAPPDVDHVHLHAWEGAMAQAPEVAPFAFDVRGSVVEQPPLPPPGPSVSKIVAWGAGLLAAGVGLGMLLASLV